MAPRIKIIVTLNLLWSEFAEKNVIKICRSRSNRRSFVLAKPLQSKFKLILMFIIWNCSLEPCTKNKTKWDIAQLGLLWNHENHQTECDLNIRSPFLDILFFNIH